MDSINMIIYFLTIKHLSNQAIEKREVIKGLIMNFLWSKFIENSICDKGFTFCLPFLHDNLTCSLKLSYWSTFLPTSFPRFLSVTILLSIFIEYDPIALLTKRWYLSEFAFTLLSWDYFNETLRTFSSSSITTLIYLSTQHRFLS